MTGDEDKFPATPTSSGWYPVNDGSDQETFWDGTAWTRRRQYRFGSPFLEIPLRRGDPPLAATPNEPASSAPVSTPALSPRPPTSMNMGGPSLMNRTIAPRTAPQPTAESPSFRTSRQRVRIIQLIYLVAIIGFFVSARGGNGSGANPQKYFVYLFFFGVVVHVLIRGATLSARREVRSQEGDRRPKWPFRYSSRLTDGLQGQRLMSFVGGMRKQPRFGPSGFNASVPMVRLSVFSNGVRLGPSSSLLSMQIPTWEARFDELDVIQAIGRVKGVTTGILFRKSQSREWVIFWTLNREQVFTAFEHMGITVSREPVRLRVGNEWRVNQFVEDELRPSVPSVLGAATAATTATEATARPSGASSPLVFAAPPSNASDRTTTAPEDRKWPGVVVVALTTLFIVATFALVFRAVSSTNPSAPGSANDGGVTTTTAPEPVVTISPAKWRTSAESDALWLPRSVFPLPNEIRSMRYDIGVTEASFTLVGVQSRLIDVNTDCFSIQYLAHDAPSTALSKIAADLGGACRDLVRVDDADLSVSGNKWTSKLASDDQHWVSVVKRRLSVFKERLSS